jgi:Flp pilus assembly protein TadD
MLEKAVQAKPDSARALAELGRAQIEAGKPREAVGSLERAVALDPAAWAVRLLLGRAYQQLGRLAEAEQELTLARKGWAAQNGR